MNKVAIAPSEANGGPTGEHSFRIGAVDVFPQTGSIDGPGGNRHLDPKVMQVLLRLVAADGEVVSRESLMTDVWRGTVVTDFALSRCIYQLRKNLRRVAKSADSPIETLPKRGYRLCWTIAGSGERRAGPTRRVRPMLAPFVLASLVLAGSFLWLSWQSSGVSDPVGAVAVMPFKDLSPDGELGYFGDGVATSLQTELGHISALSVIARTSALHFRNSQASSREIGAALGVGYLVEGSVRNEGGSVHVTASLVDAANGRQVWSEEFAGAADRPFTAQKDIAREIAGYLQLSLGDSRKHGGTTNFEAYQAYLKGMDIENPDVAGLLFDEALTYDPQFALAMVAKANLIYRQLWWGERPEQQAWDEARPLLEGALSISDEIPLAHTLIGGFQFRLENYPVAEAELRRALEINPSDDNALAHLSRLMERTDRIEEAVTLAERNARLDPMNPLRHVQLANRLWTSGNFEKGKAAFERAVALDPLNFWSDYVLRVSNTEGVLAAFRLVAGFQKNPEFRAKFLGPRPELSPEDIARVSLWFGFIGDYEHKRELLELQASIADNARLHRELAWVLSAEGDLEGARREAWKGLQGMPRESIVNHCVAYLALRSGSGYQEVLDQYRKYWPGLFTEPPDLSSVPKMISIGAALIMRRQGQEQHALALLHLIREQGEAPWNETAMAQAHLGDISGALDSLEAFLANGGFFAHPPEDPFFAPLSEEPRFKAIEAAAEKNHAEVREAVNAMLADGELILPGHIDAESRLANIQD